MPKGMCNGCWNYGELATDKEGFTLNLCPACKEREDGQMHSRNVERSMRTMSRTEIR